MTQRLQAIRGMNDILPSDSDNWLYLEGEAHQLLAGYGYRNIRMPILESTELFQRTIGEVTDIVEKEMYTFEDRNGERVSLRPEGTASVVRAGEQHGLLYNQIQRLWYQGPMFRYEKPQKGRYRQFHQIGAEVFGMAGPEIDAEMISMTHALWKRLGVLDYVQLEINSLGNSSSRSKYKDALVAYLSQFKEQLDDDSQRRLGSNPLRILDTKDVGTQKILEGAPELASYLAQEELEHFQQLKLLLDQLGVDYVVNPKLVRGLDYYNLTVFEWVTSKLGSQGTVCAGGRYDGLVDQLGGKSTPAIGFAMGVERLLLLLESADAFPAGIDNYCDVYVIPLEEKGFSAAVRLAADLRHAVDGIKVITHCGQGSVKSKMKKADKSTATFAVLIGDEELNSGSITLKSLRENDEQKTLSGDALAEYLKAYFKG